MFTKPPGVAITMYLPTSLELWLKFLLCWWWRDGVQCTTTWLDCNNLKSFAACDFDPILLYFYRSLSWTIQEKSTTVTHLCWTVTQPISLVNLPKLRKNVIAVVARNWKTIPSASSLGMLPWSTWSHRSPCASRLSRNTHPWGDSPCATWGRLWPSESSNPWWRRRRLVARSPRPHRKLPRSD